ncbi:MULTISPECIES: DUF1566 domain-containing protein [Flavobacterium]|uniref:DUF1566 domain-containing protein n=1 Tax=Flavobacterium jumunjinense TaxID=998845 RepID=A0ABV5GJH9_9FLAO|nr:MULTISPECIES: DUF1566 domain-containing protein [Flavobacterium]
MKKIITLIAVLLLNTIAFAQAPEKMSYQAVIRDASNALITNQSVGMQISILQGSTNGTAVYVETQNPTTNNNGLVSIEIGSGTNVSGVFSNINWGSDSFFIKTETDPDGGTNYTITGTSQLMSVPYALHAKTAESVGNYTTYAIGDQLQGGIVFYVDQSGQHGLLCAIEDQSTGAPWQITSNEMTGAQFYGIGGGYANTMLIIASQRGDYDANYAAKLCSRYYTYSTSLGLVYGNWYLPNIVELQLMQGSKDVINATATTMGGSNLVGEYWTSREGGQTTDGHAQTVYMSGGTGGRAKTDLKSVRAIKAF